MDYSPTLLYRTQSTYFLLLAPHKTHNLYISVMAVFFNGRGVTPYALSLQKTSKLLPDGLSLLNKRHLYQFQNIKRHCLDVFQYHHRIIKNTSFVSLHMLCFPANVPRGGKSISPRYFSVRSDSRIFPLIQTSPASSVFVEVLPN